MMLIPIAVIGLQIGLISPIVDLIPMPESIQKIFLEFSKQNGPFSFMAVVIAAPIFEELIFRGVILDGLLRNYSPLNLFFLECPVWCDPFESLAICSGYDTWNLFRMGVL
jgi:membrane protease YdiL (CAAX protease family)